MEIPIPTTEPPERKGAGAFVAFEGTRQCRQRRAELQRRAGALQRARRDENRKVRRRAAEERGDREQAQSGDEDGFAPEPIGEGAGRKQKRGKGERVSRNHPFDTGEIRLEGFSYRGQRHRDDIGIELKHERRRRHANQDQQRAIRGERRLRLIDDGVHCLRSNGKIRTRTGQCHCRTTSSPSSPRPA
jgi:hypothetical protein